MPDPKLIVAAIILGIAGVVGMVLTRGVARFDLGPEQRIRTKNMVRYALGLVVVISWAVIWANELQEAALVASGFAVAIVLFNKELILSVLGWWLKTVSGAYRIGDRIRVGNVRGDVIDYGVLFTTLMQVHSDADHGMRTGNVVTIPNAMLLSESLINETRILGFEWKEVHFTLPRGADWKAAEAVLDATAQSIVEEHREDLLDALKEMADSFAFHPIQDQPHVFVKPQDDGKIRIWVRLALPARGIAIGADRLNRAFLEWQSSVTEV